MSVLTMVLIASFRHQMTTRNCIDFPLIYFALSGNLLRLKTPRINSYLQRAATGSLFFIASRYRLQKTQRPERISPNGPMCAVSRARLAQALCERTAI
jgi:hypothetical protein